MGNLSENFYIISAPRSWIQLPVGRWNHLEINRNFPQIPIISPKILSETSWKDLQGVSHTTVDLLKQA